MKRFYISIILFFLIIPTFYAQGTAGSSAKYEYRRLVDLPTAGVLEKGISAFSIDVLPFGTVITSLEVGVFTNFSFGISYGGSNIIGSGEVSWYKLPGVNARLRLFDETETIPAIVIGFDSQGKGEYFDDLKRYQIKSPGFFAAGAKNFEFLGYLSLHAVINYSLEALEEERGFTVGFGVEKTIGKTISLIAEYNLALNDVENIGSGKGYLNAGLRWSVSSGFTLGVDLRDILSNNVLTTASADRAIFVEYITPLF